MDRRRRLGRSDIEVTPIGLGTWQFSKGQGFVGSYWKSIDDDRSASVVRAALDAGIDWFDTAEVYGNGASERSLASGLVASGARPGSFRIATKWFPLLRGARSIGSTIDERLACLAPWPIDLHQVHQPFSLSSIERQANAMADLVDAGKVKAVGISNFSAKAMREFHSVLARRNIPLASNQIHLSLLHRPIEDDGVLSAAKELGVTLIAYSPLAQGILSGRFHEDPESVAQLTSMRRMRSSINSATLERTAPLVAELRKVAERHGASPGQVALNWLVSHWGPTVVAIPGASRPAQATSAGGAMAFDLGPEEDEAIDRLSRAACALR